MTTQAAPLVSVTLTNYNYARFLPAAIESILEQTFTDFELLVIDNASTDDSLDVIDRYAEADERMRVIRHERNVGALASLRESCDAARGTYRVHVDADDWIIARDALERQVTMLERNPNMSFVFSSMTIFGPSGTKIHVARPFQGDVVVAGRDAVLAVLDSSFSHSGMMVRLDAYRASGGYPDGLPHTDDLLLGVRLCELGVVGYIDDELYAFRQHGGNEHLRLEPSIVRDEFLPVVEAAFHGPLGPQLPAAVRRRVLRRVLVHLPTQSIFRGQWRWGWRLWWESFKVRPVETAIQPRTLSLIARTLLGESGFAVLQRWTGR
jgi:glycosyltransferase involved in cell wall biosynthesis